MSKKSKYSDHLISKLQIITTFTVEKTALSDLYQYGYYPPSSFISVTLLEAFWPRRYFCAVNVTNTKNEYSVLLSSPRLFLISFTGC